LTEQKLELSTVKRLTDELSKAVANALIKTGRVQSHSSDETQDLGSRHDLSDAARCTWMISCLLSLSKRALIPDNLRARSSGNAIRELGTQFFGTKTFHLDDCEMALVTGKTIAAIEESFTNTELSSAFTAALSVLQQYLKAPKKEKTESSVSNALFTGWVYQYLLQQSERGLKKNGGLRGQSGNSPFYTKWFTPHWIAEFLVEDAIKNPDMTFIDPACGAGHILVPALERSVALLIDEGLQKKEALKIAIEKLIYGVDVDQALTAAAHFSLYIAARDIDLATPLKTSNIFTVVDNSIKDDVRPSLAGSLCLAFEGSHLSKFTHLRRVGCEDLLELRSLPKKFGALAANPPYMSMRHMPRELSQFLKQNFPLSKYDLYSAFVELSLKLLEENARASIICQQSFLSISRYKPLRQLVKEESKIETLIQLGSGSFPSRSGEKVNNAIITLRKVSKDREIGLETLLHFARILYPEEKRDAETRGIKSVLDIREHSNAFDETESKTTLAPWCPAFVQELFEKYPPLQNTDNGIVAINGLFTCNNKLFVKTLDEVSESEIHEYVPYDKGGGKKWYHSTRYLLHWIDNGKVIREYRASRGQSRSLPGEEYYFREGITYSYIGTQGFKARLLSPDSIFDIASSSVFAPEALRMYILGFLNSALVRYLMGVLNPTINFQIGDLRKLPYAKPDSSTQFAVSKLAEEAVALAREVEKLEGKASDDDFLAWARAKENVIQSDIDRLIFALYEVPSRVQKQILKDPWVVRGQKNIFTAAARRLRSSAIKQD